MKCVGRDDLGRAVVVAFSTGSGMNAVTTPSLTRRTRMPRFQPSCGQYNAGSTDLGGMKPVISAGFLLLSARRPDLLNFSCLKLS